MGSNMAASSPPRSFCPVPTLDKNTKQVSLLGDGIFQFEQVLSARYHTRLRLATKTANFSQHSIHYVAQFYSIQFGELAKKLGTSLLC
jgi:hypothetical protein